MRDLQVAQIERVGHHAHALAGICRGVGDRDGVGCRTLELLVRGILFVVTRYRLCCTGNVVQHPGAVAVERAVHLLGAVGEAVEQLRLGDGAGKGFHSGSGVRLGKRMRAAERHQAAVLAQEAPHHRVLVGGVDSALGKRGHQARARRDGTLVLGVERGGLHLAHGGDGLGGALRFHERIRQALGHAAIRRVVFDIEIALALRSQGLLRPRGKLGCPAIGAPRFEHGMHHALARHLGIGRVIARPRGIEQFAWVSGDRSLEAVALGIKRTVQVDLEQRGGLGLARLLGKGGSAEHGGHRLLRPCGGRILRRGAIGQWERHQLHPRDTGLAGEGAVGEQQAHAHDIGKRRPLFAACTARHQALRRHGQAKRRLAGADVARKLHIDAHREAQLLDGQRQAAAHPPFAALMPKRGVIRHAARQFLLAHRDEQLRILPTAFLKPGSIGAIAHTLAQQDETVERRLYPPQLLIGDVGIFLIAYQIGQVSILRGTHQTHGLVGDATLMDGEQAGLFEVFQQKLNGAGGFELRVRHRALDLARKLAQRLEGFFGPKRVEHAHDAAAGDGRRAHGRPEAQREIRARHELLVGHGLALVEAIPRIRYLIQVGRSFIGRDAARRVALAVAHVYIPGGFHGILRQIGESGDLHVGRAGRWRDLRLIAGEHAPIPVQVRHDAHGLVAGGIALQMHQVHAAAFRLRPHHAAAHHAERPGKHGAVGKRGHGVAQDLATHAQQLLMRLKPPQAFFSRNLLHAEPSFQMLANSLPECAKSRRPSGRRLFAIDGCGAGNGKRRTGHLGLRLRSVRRRGRGR